MAEDKMYAWIGIFDQAFNFTCAFMDPDKVKKNYANTQRS